MNKFKAVIASAVFAILAMAGSVAHGQSLVTLIDSGNIVRGGNYSGTFAEVTSQAVQAVPGYYTYSVQSFVDEPFFGSGLLFSPIGDVFIETASTLVAADVVVASGAFTVGERVLGGVPLYGITFQGANASFTTAFAPGLASFWVSGSNPIDSLSNLGFGSTPPGGAPPSFVQDYVYGPMVAAPVPELSTWASMLFGLLLIGLKTARRRT